MLEREAVHVPGDGLPWAGTERFATVTPLGWHRPAALWPLLPATGPMDGVLFANPTFGERAGVCVTAARRRHR